MNNIILTGFMGSGKSTVGIRLSYRLKCVVEDTDKRIEREQGRTVNEIFGTEGEACFRNLETECLKKMLSEPGSKIISVGGGLPLREENRKLLKQLGTVVYLRISPEKAYERLKEDDSRPLLRGEDPLGKIRKLMQEREPVYAEAADITVDVDDKDMEEILEWITKRCRITEKEEVK